MALYTTYGAVRGYCGHNHQNRTTALACLRRDREGCAAQGGYSDRGVYAIDAEGYLMCEDGSPEEYRKYCASLGETK